MSKHELHLMSSLLDCRVELLDPDNYVDRVVQHFARDLFARTPPQYAIESIQLHELRDGAAVKLICTAELYKLLPLDDEKEGDS